MNKTRYHFKKRPENSSSVYWYKPSRYTATQILSLCFFTLVLRRTTGYN